MPGHVISPYVGGGVLRTTSIFYVGEDDYEVFAGDYFYNRYFHEELPSTYVPGYAGLDAFVGVAARSELGVDGALELFFIPVRLGMPDSYTTPDGETVSMLTQGGERSAYVTNYFSVRLRVGYTF